MSDSRLEKFIYAICSMDVSDLPVPLSRIEKLWNCLITGETPDFEPLSRNEKYLMAMLDRYDISNLPAPMSRGEKLLYKIAVGETDLSDVPDYLSRYEELLKYLIENGGISGGDFEYVLYTLNQSLYTLYATAEKPVKSAILKGQTLVNVDSYYDKTYFNQSNIDSISEDGYIQVSATGGYRNVYTYISSLIKPSTQYLFIIEIKENTLDGSFFILTDGNPSSCFGGSFTQTITSKTTGLFKYKVTTINDLTNCQLCLRNFVDSSATSGKIVFRTMLIEYQEGMENLDIPFFRGMQSVKMPVLTTTGKNLFGIDKLSGGTITTFNGKKVYKYVDNATNFRFKGSFKDNTQYTFAYKIYRNEGELKNTDIYFEYSDGTEVKYNAIVNYLSTFTSEKGKTLIGIKGTFNHGKDVYIDLEETQLEESSTATEYEPFKSNILSCNEEVMLRGIGDVKDEMNLLTGELTERIGEIVLDGSKVYYPGGNSNDNYLEFIVRMNNAKRASALCDKVFIPSGGHQNNTEYVRVTESGIIGYISKTRLSTPDVDGLKAWLSSNNVTVQYQLATPITKSIDISTVDQDNQPTELGTFENITHVSLEAEGLIPEVEMEVATNLLEDTVFNLTNAFNTLYPTAAKPVKSAILKGQTLVNIVPSYVIDYTAESNWDGFQKLVQNSTQSSDQWRTLQDIKPNTKYYISCYVETFEDVNNRCYCLNNAGSSCVFGESMDINSVGRYQWILTTKSELTDETFIVLRCQNAYARGAVKIRDIMIIEYVDGMENWDIPYFEGMQSVKMPVLKTTGKNLFNKNNIIVDGYIVSNGALAYETGDNRNAADFIEVEPNCIYSISGIKNSAINGGRTHQYVGMYDKNKKFISSAAIYCLGDKETITTAENTKYIRVSVRNDDINRLQIEKGTTATTYEPHKSNILSTPEDVTLRGVGEVKDTLNLTTGEYTKTIHEYTFTGDEDWQIRGGGTGGYTYFTFNSGQLPIKFNYKSEMNIPISCDKLPIITHSDFDGGLKNVGVNLSYFIRLNFNDCNSNNGATAEDLKAYLKANPTTVQYPISKSVKTVDLTVVDQDDNETKLRTFDDTTHVLLESEGLIPTASLTVRTKIPTASSTNLLMDTVSTEQEQLNTTVNEQSENVDATLIATTEIYEGTL